MDFSKRGRFSFAEGMKQTWYYAKRGKIKRKYITFWDFAKVADF
jgi:hypothetical protein